VSNQIAWFSIGIASWRFRKAWVIQGRSLDELKFRAGWTWPWGPPFVVIAVAAIIIVQGWSSVIPTFSPVSFVSFYIEIPVMIVMYIFWVLTRHLRSQPQSPLSARIPGLAASEEPVSENPRSPSRTPLFQGNSNSLGRVRTSSQDRDGRKNTESERGKRWWSYLDVVDTYTVDLYRDEHEEEEVDQLEAEEREKRLKNNNLVLRALWKLFYLIV
jgi:hypothetical protein